jgi:hypothetical protein
VENHISPIVSKLGMTDRILASILAIQHKLDKDKTRAVFNKECKGFPDMMTHHQDLLFLNIADFFMGPYFTRL